MNHKFLSLMAAAVAMAITGCSHTPKDDGLGHDHHHHHEHAEAHEHGEHDEDEEHHGDEIVLKPEIAEQLGVATTTLEPVEFAETIKVTGTLTRSTSGQSIAATTSAGIITLKPGAVPGAKVKAGQVIATVSASGMAGGDSNAASKAALDAARRELERLKPLHDEGIVSARDYNAALAAYESARAAYSGTPAGGVAKAPASGEITSLDVATGQYVETGQPIATIGDGSSLLLRADVPTSQRTFLNKLSSANISLPGSDQVISLSEVGGKLISPSTASTTGGYIPVYFTLNNGGQLMPGTNVEVYLLGSSRSESLVIPRDAIIEQQGTHFAFVRLDEDCYRKCPVTLGNSDGRNVEILSGLNPGDDVVTSGAIMIKLAESSTAVPEGHSHNH